MLNLEPLDVIPFDIVADFRCELHKAVPVLAGSFRLVNIRKTGTKDWESGKIIVLVVDEKGQSLPGVPVHFAYSTADYFIVGPDFDWTPPHPFQAHVVSTEGSGQIEQVQGSAVKEGYPGGVTVYIGEPKYSSDYVTGCGMLADHTGLHLTFQLRRTGIVPLPERLAAIEARLDALEQ